MTMKIHLLILTTLIVISCNDNKPVDKPIAKISVDTVTVDPYSCEWGQIESKKDIKNDSLMLIRFGLPAKATNYYWKILGSEYHVYTKFAVGCQVDDGIRCYNKCMSDKIIEKYGTDIFDKASHKADSLYAVENKK